ncbi:hypothetical protein [Actinomadura sp. DC4]|uniref:hypothetical protein n=1 Tax=Actinomadura sp. DC4 TaxID=3055069 RepID=UPI0025AF1FD7|nr:hypothetical protein [Actinomadura sp. DC4]MDN3351771.1 hypothetical protein [Actinomadura sp. DC4]
MWRVATATLTAGVIITALGPASADTGFWRSAGLPGVDAFGVYRTRPARVALAFFLKDTRKDRYGAAVRFSFTERHHRNAVRVVALRPAGAKRRWRTVQSANTGHLYVQECVGRWHGKAFRIKKCGGWRRRY